MNGDELKKESQPSSSATILPGSGQRVGIIGVPLAFGADLAGVDLGPSALRVARLNKRISGLGYVVRDLGDIRVARTDEREDVPRNAKHLKEIAEACQALAVEVKNVLMAGELPVVLGGDHSIAAGSISGAASFYRGRQQSIGLIWVDAHADMNTPETTRSGNVHGMPLAALLGFGAKELTHLEGFAPKLDPKFCAHIGARDLDPPERELIRRLGLRFFTMREIDERGMGACIDEAIAIAAKAQAGYCVTWDVDSLDPSDAPGSGTVVRGGLTYREAHLAMEKISEAGGLRLLELVEINTVLDHNNRTAELGVELILSALGKTIL
jgi:arginase